MSALSNPAPAARGRDLTGPLGTRRTSFSTELVIRMSLRPTDRGPDLAAPVQTITLNGTLTAPSALTRALPAPWYIQPEVRVTTVIPVSTPEELARAIRLHNVPDRADLAAPASTQVRGPRDYILDGHLSSVAEEAFVDAVDRSATGAETLLLGQRFGGPAVRAAMASPDWSATHGWKARIGSEWVHVTVEVETPGTPRTLTGSDGLTAQQGHLTIDRHGRAERGRFAADPDMTLPCSPGPSASARCASTTRPW